MLDVHIDSYTSGKGDANCTVNGFSRPKILMW